MSSTEGDKIFMIRCVDCKKENWAPAVSSGQCAWCGYIATENDVNGGTVFKPKLDNYERTSL